MPIYEYSCRACEHGFEALVSASRPASCPKCGSSQLEKKLSAFAVQAANPVAVGGGPCGTCGDPRGPGTCSM
ncbi:MAG: FmdB family transcriptional regulator [Gemmatimonadetes bacterium]|nr:FmdB family transcriptional regulator [Gemmatimonadota bacterium]